MRFQTTIRSKEEPIRSDEEPMRSGKIRLWEARNRKFTLVLVTIIEIVKSQGFEVPNYHNEC